MVVFQVKILIFNIDSIYMYYIYSILWNKKKYIYLHYIYAATLFLNKSVTFFLLFVSDILNFHSKSPQASLKNPTYH